MREFLLQAFTLKELPRAGWLRVGIDHPESVAAHSWGLALLCLELAPKELNLQRILALALVHDLPEVLVGDITPHDGVSKEKKQALEQEAAESFLPSHLRDIWLEYVENQTPEAQFVHKMDKLDMLLQAQKYSTKADISEFIQSALEKLGDEYIHFC